jgi:hypothetical protein
MLKCFSDNNLLLDICVRVPSQIEEILKGPSDEIMMYKNGRSGALASEQKGKREKGKLGGRWGVQNIRTGT